MVADRHLPTPDRVSTFRDIIDSEIGGISKTRVWNIERLVILRHLFLKFEGGYPTGKQKDQITLPP